MKIKKLTVNGFKSFMDKLDILFPAGISAVVGPNGCGKSNIVDAIRWAMGEQSAKQLRGRNMEDIIFNGAQEHKALGMAEVTIVLENGNGSFPAEYSNAEEISITRRLYRSGESEYRINNVPCRLKDIHELFMDTGLGNRAYSIIGQGRIGTIVEQKPEETRVMLEEAAGITKYKKKEAESRRKLDLTKRNLNRVEDILVEVQSQMRSLKRQASKARRYKALGQEIQRLEILIHSNNYNELLKESGSRKKSSEDLIEQELAVTAEFSSAQAEIEKMNMELEEKDHNISILRNRYLNLKDSFNKKEAALESLTNEKRMQRQMEERLCREEADTRKRVVALGEEKASLQERVDSLENESVELNEEISIVEKRLFSRRTLLAEAKEEFEMARNRVSSGVNKEIGLNKESDYLNKKITEITDSSTRIEQERNDIALKVEALLNSSNTKNETRSALSKKLEDIEGDIHTGKQEVEELERIRNNIENEIKKVDGELNSCNSRIASLRSLTENFEGYKVGVRTVMKATDLKARNEGKILGLVADVIQVESQYEQAVEAVLADKLQYIIVEEQEHGLEAIEYLKSKAKGRSSFIPIKNTFSHNNNGNGNGLPLLRNLVTVQEQYKPIVNLLLGDTTLTKDLTQAVSEWRNNGRDHSFVTPDGDMVDERGIISGGKLAPGSHGLLARKREIRELEEKISKCNNLLEDQKSRLASVEYGIEEKKISINSLEEEKWDCHEKINELDKILFQISHELDQLESLNEKLLNELEQKSREQNRNTEDLDRIKNELQQCIESKRKEEEYLSRKEKELKETEEEYDEIRDELEQLKMKYNLSREEEKGLVREIERIENFCDEAQDKLTLLEKDILESKEKQAGFSDMESGLKEELKSFYVMLEEAEEAVNKGEQDRNNFNTEIRHEKNKEEGLREKLDQIKEKITGLKMEQSEIQFKLDNLVETVRERFNQNLLEIYREYLEEGFSKTDYRDQLEQQKLLREKLGEVNLMAIQEHEALKERHEFIQTQREDLLKSIDSITQVIRKINKTCLEKFMETFREADSKIKQVFPILFNGGNAGLKLTDESNPLESGVLVEVRPPGKKLSHMGLLSGGEKALVAMSLLFAIYLIKPSPFCLLDEVDAPLDEANIDRFNNLLKEIRKYSQILVVTHNRRTMEIVDSLYGVTMEKAGISKMVAVNLNGNNMN